MSRRASGPRLKVAVPPSIGHVGRRTGHGNAWANLVEHLQPLVDLVVEEPAAPRRGRSAVKGFLAKRPDVWLADGHGARLEVREPIVVLVHDLGWGTPELDAMFDPVFLANVDAATGAAVRSAALVMSASEATARDVVDKYGVSPDRVRVVPHGVDHHTFRPRPGGPELVAAAGGDPAVPYVLYVSSLHPRKNLGALRDAMDRLALEGFPHQLVLVGAEAPDRADSAVLVAQATAPLERSRRAVIRVVGPDDEDLAALMAGAAAFCLPSLIEGFGMTVLEAMACGAPVVCTDRGSLPEVIGDAGVVVQPDPESIAAGLRQVLGDQAEASRLGRAALERAAGFRWEQAAAGWLTALREVVGP